MAARLDDREFAASCYHNIYFIWRFFKYYIVCFIWYIYWYKIKLKSENLKSAKGILRFYFIFRPYRLSVQNLVTVLVSSFTWSGLINSHKSWNCRQLFHFILIALGFCALVLSFGLYIVVLLTDWKWLKYKFFWFFWYSKITMQY